MGAWEESGCWLFDEQNGWCCGDRCDEDGYMMERLEELLDQWILGERCTGDEIVVKDFLQACYVYTAALRSREHRIEKNT